MNKEIPIIIICFVLIFSQCKPKEKVIIQEMTHILSTEELEKNITGNRSDIHTLKLSKIDFTVNINNEKYNFNGTIGIIKDSIIVMSLIPMLGYEIARVYCNYDSVLIIDRKNKTIYQSSIKTQLRKFDLNGDYQMIQGLLLNKAVSYGLNVKDAVYKKNIIKDDDYYYYTIETIKEDIIISQQKMKFRAEDLLNENIMIVDYLFQKRLEINYADFQNVDSIIFPKLIEIRMIDSQGAINIVISIGNIELNGKVNAGISIPENYNRIII